MRTVLLVSLLTAAVLPQASPLGMFTGSNDIGAPPLKGGAQYNPATRQYTITGTGTDIWGRADQFHYAWREMSGNFTVSATAEFLTDGNPHRKASIMLRKSLDADAAFVHLAIHGDGMPGVQFRATKGDTVNTLDFPIEGAGTFSLKLVRQGGNVNVFAAKDGAALRELGTTVLALGNQVLVGLAVASHSQQALNTVLFSNVSIEQLAAPAQAPAPAR
jgi:TolB protein